MKAVLISFVLASVLGFWGCASNVAKPGPGASQALIIARAAGFQAVRDITAENLQSVTASQGSNLKMAEAVGKATGALKPTPGIPVGLEAAFLFLSSMPVAQREGMPRLIVWMPSDLASSPAAATVTLRETLFRAFASTLPQAKVELREKVYEEKPILAPNKIRHLWTIHIEASDCVDCSFSTPAIHGYSTPSVVKAPAFLGSHDVYFWEGMSFRQETHISGYPWTAATLDPPQRLAFLRQLSANLPAWTYIYIPYDPKVAPYPQILHQGKELIFVEPALDEPERGESNDG